MKIYRFDESESFQTPEGLMTPLFANNHLTVTHLKVPAGIHVRPHSHPWDGILIIINGFVRLIGTTTFDMKAGDLAYIPAGFEVGLDCQEYFEAILLSTPSPYKTLEEFRNRLEGMFLKQKEHV